MKVDDDIVEKKVNLNQENFDFFNEYKILAKLSKEKLFEKYHTNIQGLSSSNAYKREKADGPNVVITEKKHYWPYFLFLSFKDAFIIILLVLAIVNFFLGDSLGSIIIVCIAIISAFIRFIQDYSEYRFNCKLKQSIFSTANIIRDGKEKNVRTEKLVVGDIVKLNAGSIIPADLIILESKDLFINQSVFTGESIPVEKNAEVTEPDNLFGLTNLCLMSSSVVSGSATGLVISTGKRTYLGNMGKTLSKKKELTNFDIGMKKITKMLIFYMILICFVVLVIDGIIKSNFSEALLFALSVAVGITPSMLPMIVNVNLTKGSKSLAKKKTLVKKIESIQNLGAIDILCTDKTGTLTENSITLQKYINIAGKEDLEILKYAYLNSYFSTGIKNLIDNAIMKYAKENKIEDLKQGYIKIDEIPFDYSRRKTSIVVKKNHTYLMLTKGALEEVIKSCTMVKKQNEIVPIDNKIVEDVKKKAKELASSGMQVIALAYRKETREDATIGFNAEDEHDMILIGFVGFLDPPKKDVKHTLEQLQKHGIQIKILTGDNEYATQSICQSVGLSQNRILLGYELDQYSDDELSRLAETTIAFARLTPLQKQRMIQIFHKNGHVVGYMGDGVNDAPSLHEADVGISVNTATDIAKEASDLILLERNLKVVYDGVIEGRKVYGNIIKYMKMALSDDFGDVFSIMLASIFLPFLPLLPIQMLVQDFIYDFSQIGIPYDNVDEEFLQYPKKWDTKGISRFMWIMGLTSSLIDALAFVIFWFILGYNTPSQASYFQTAWFVVCLVTELLIIHNIRTSKRAFIESRASNTLLGLSLLSLGLTIIVPILLSTIPSFGFVILPLDYYAWIILLVVLYMVIVNVIKKIYIAKYHEWL